MIKLYRIMVWVSVVMTVASLGMFVYEIASGGNWWWGAVAFAVWGCNIFGWLSNLGQEVRYRALPTTFTANHNVDR